MAEHQKPDKAMAGMLKRKSVWPLVSAGTACPDAATLAAYFERSLTAAETSLWETHFSSCARCQEQLAALVRSEPASQAKSAEAKKPAFSWLWDWRVLAPVGTAVVVLAFFISLKTMYAPVASPVGGELMAKREATTQAPPAAEPPASADAATKQVEKSRSASNEIQQKNAALAAEAEKGNLPLKDKSAAKSPAIVADAVPSRVLAKPAEENQLAAAAGRAAPSQPAPAVIGGEAQAESARTRPRIVEADRAQATPAPPQAGVPSAQTLQKLNRAAATSESKEAPVQAPSESQLKQQMAARKQEGAEDKKAATGGGIAVQRALKSSAKSLMAPGEFIVTTPNPKVLWRFGPSGLIERSLDAGKSWETQESSAQESFLSGSAPSESICWVGGSNGVLLRTMDGGDNWERIPSPTKSDIIAVQARDSFNVTVTGADGRSYETRNAGTRWRAR